MQSRKDQKKQARLRKKWKRATIKYIVLSVVTALLLVVGGLALLLTLVFNGPSQHVSDLAALAMDESSAAKFVPRLFLGEDGMNAVLSRNTIQEINEEVNTQLIDTTLATSDEGDEETPDIEIVEVKGGTYRGYMMIVKDPSRVIVGVCASTFSTTAPGKLLPDIVAHYNGVGGINAGGFWDNGGQGNGGFPIGLVISQGKLMNNAYDNASYNTAIGFDQNNVLIVQKMNTETAVKRGLRDAVAFGPGLIVNGEPAAITGTSGGVNPRSAIGQRADGAVLLLVIDGRQVNSLGAGMSDLISVMLEYGAVNAANLDGGSSSKLYYNGEFINDGVAVTGSRRLATAFIVK